MKKKESDKWAFMNREIGNRRGREQWPNPILPVSYFLWHPQPFKIKTALLDQ